MIRIRYLHKFLKAVKNLSFENQNHLSKKIIIFQQDPNDKRLKTHKLTGKLSSMYSFSVNYSIRVVFEYSGRNEVTFLSVGTHEVYK